MNNATHDPGAYQTVQNEKIDPMRFRDALGCFATGVAVVTTLDQEERPVGLTVNSFNSVSLDPPLVLWSLKLGTASLKAFRTHDAFAVNILSAEQKDVCMNFAVPKRDKFAAIEWTPGLDGVPLIDNAFVQFECRTVARFPGGDHEIYVGVVAKITQADKQPLVYFRGNFAELIPAAKD